MTVTYSGSLTLGQAVPMASTAAASIDASVGAVLPDVQARVNGLLALSVEPPPSLASLISSASALVTALQSLVSAPLPDVVATATALADLQATLGSLNAALAFSAGLGNLLSTAGIHYYLFAGAAGDLGGELGSMLSGGLPGGAGATEHIAGAILLANDGGAITALQTVLKS